MEPLRINHRALSGRAHLRVRVRAIRLPPRKSTAQAGSSFGNHFVNKEAEARRINADKVSMMVSYAAGGNIARTAAEPLGKHGSRICSLQMAHGPREREATQGEEQRYRVSHREMQARDGDGVGRSLFTTMIDDGRKRRGRGGRGGNGGSPESGEETEMKGEARNGYNVFR